LTGLLCTDRATNRISKIPKTINISDTDNNGYLDERDFACLALRATIIEGKGEFSFSRLQEYQHIMLGLWEEIAELADFNKVWLLGSWPAFSITALSTHRFPHTRAH
jgi:hypothetical protein